MATAIGDLAVILSADTTGFGKGLRRAEADTTSWAARVGIEAGKGSQAFRGTAMSLQNLAEVLSRGGGLQGALTSALGPLQAALFVMNPLVGAVGGLAAGLAAGLIPRLFETGKATENATKKLDEFHQSLVRAREAERSTRTESEQHEALLRRFPEAAGDQGDEIRALGQRADDLRKQIVERERIRDEIVHRMEQAGRRELDIGFARRVQQLRITRLEEDLVNILDREERIRKNIARLDEARAFLEAKARVDVKAQAGAWEQILEAREKVGAIEHAARLAREAEEAARTRTPAGVEIPLSQQQPVAAPEAPKPEVFPSATESFKTSVDAIEKSVTSAVGAMRANEKIENGVNKTNTLLGELIRQGRDRDQPKIVDLKQP